MNGWQIKGRLDTLGKFSFIFERGDNLCDFCFIVHQFSSVKGSSLKGKNLLPLGSKFFPFRVDPFSEQKQKQF